MEPFSGVVSLRLFRAFSRAFSGMKFSMSFWREVFGHLWVSACVPVAFRTLPE
jgi:hypothetical protein